MGSTTENVNNIEKLVIEELGKVKQYNKFKYPLNEKTYNEEEVMAMIKVLLSDKLTMGSETTAFEKEFAEYVGSKYAVMVNSGSSANLLEIACITNSMYSKKLVKGDKIIVPTICWSTSVWPLIQCGLEPVFVDIEAYSLNADFNEIKKLVENDDKIKAVLAVHILGNTTNMDALTALCAKHKLQLIEDTCEALGSTYNGKYLGTFGECGSYSFYFSHHLTTIEGGMVVCNSKEVYELLKCLRAHGWTRHLIDENRRWYEDKYPEIDPKFLFINVGYNFRPMETQAAMGRIQLKKLAGRNANRRKNFAAVNKLVLASKTDKLKSVVATDNCDPAWFGLPFILNEKVDKKKYLSAVESKGFDTRPVVTGNFTRQPAFKLLGYDVNADDFPNANIVHDRGFFIGLPSRKMTDEEIQETADALISS